MEWAPVNEIIVKTIFHLRFARTTVLQTHVLTNKAFKDENKDSYEQLQIEKTSMHDILPLMGDVNAKMGVTNEQWKGTIEAEGGGVMNKNEERLRSWNLCSMNDLVIRELYSNTMTFTSESPNHGDRNQIDHAAITSRFRRSLLDTRGTRGPDVGGDHHLVMAK